MFQLAAAYFNGYVSDIEVLWVLITSIGAIFSIHNLIESRRDLKVLKMRGVRNGRMKIALTGIRAETGRLVIQTIFLIVGIDAMTLQEAPIYPHEPWHIALTRFLFQWGFIAASAILTLKSYWNYSLRRDLIEHGIKLEPHETQPDYKQEG